MFPLRLSGYMVLTILFREYVKPLQELYQIHLLLLDYYRNLDDWDSPQTHDLTLIGLRKTLRDELNALRCARVALYKPVQTGSAINGEISISKSHVIAREWEGGFENPGLYSITFILTTHVY